MSVEVNPVGARCERKCTYCHELPVRLAVRNASPGPVDHEKVQLAVTRAAGKDGFSLFGGEPLLASLEDLERLWAFGLERYGVNGIQTDGALISDAHVALFKTYRVHVGFSIDGPGALNDARRAGSLDQTRSATARSEAALLRCLAEGVPASLIVTLHRMNASPERLPELVAWLEGLDRAGLTSCRAHLLERDGAWKPLVLSDGENIAALFALRDLERRMPRLRFDVFADLERKLMDPATDVTCIWNGCDPWTTTAVHGIEPDGTRSLCHRVHKDGRSWLPADGGPVKIRQVLLWETPQEQGGCHGCWFFLVCGGQCPGTAEEGDWRRRTADCRVWYAAMERVEAELQAAGKSPISAAPTGFEDRVARSLGAGMATSAPRVDGHGDTPHGDFHADHTDHVDAPHQDSHMDLTGGEAVP